MKFNTLFLLSLASSALAFSVPMKRDQFEDEAQTLSQIFDGQNFDSEQANTQGSQAFNEFASSMESLTDPACQKAGEALSKCNINSKDVKAACNAFNTDECQAAIKQNFSDCKAFESLYGLAIASLKLTCTKDENGNYCPISKDSQSNKEEFDENSLTETCKSRVCTQQAIEGLSTLKTSMNKMAALNSEEAANIDKYIATLNEQKCIDAHSGASKVKVGGTLLLTLALILSYF